MLLRCLGLCLCALCSLTAWADDEIVFEVDPRFKVKLNPEEDSLSKEQLNEVQGDERLILQQLADDELGLGQDERRAPFHYQFGFGTGVAIPWQKFTATFRWQLSDFAYHEIHAGVGDFEFHNLEENRNYDLKIYSQSLFYGIQFFIHDDIPLYIAPLIGFGRWNGQLKPSGVDPELDTTASKLDSSFILMGAVLGANIGFQWVFNNGWFIDYSAMRIGRGFITERSFTEASDDAVTIVEKTIQHPMTWGLLNIKIGRFF